MLTYIDDYLDCFDGVRLDASKRCDGYPDCAEGEDETNCSIDQSGERAVVVGEYRGI